MSTALAILLMCAPQQQQPPRPAQGQPAAPAAQAGMPTHQPEEFEILRTKTGITLAEKTFEGDFTVAFLSWDDFHDDDFDLDVRAMTFEGTYGITDWITVEMEIPFLWVDPDPGSKESGIGDIMLEGKMSFNKARKSPAGFVPYDIAGGMRIWLPTGDEDEGTGREKAALGLFGAASHRLEPWVAVHGELYFTFASGSRPEHGINLAADFTPWMPELSLLGGLNYRREGMERTELSLILGGEYRWLQPLKGMSAGAGLLLGLTDDSPDWGLFLDFQLRL